MSRLTIYPYRLLHSLQQLQPLPDLPLQPLPDLLLQPACLHLCVLELGLPHQLEEQGRPLGTRAQNLQLSHC